MAGVKVRDIEKRTVVTPVYKALAFSYTTFMKQWCTAMQTTVIPKLGGLSYANYNPFNPNEQHLNS